MHLKPGASSKPRPCCKLLDAEPDNLRVQTRLAELSLAMGQPGEAAARSRRGAQLLERGDHAER